MAKVKQCSNCKEEKPLSAFYEDSRYMLGVRSRCKLCEVSCKKAWRANKRKDPIYLEKRLNRQREYRKQNYQQILAYNKKWLEENAEHNRAVRRSYCRKYYKTEKGLAVKNNQQQRRRSQLKITDINSEWLLNLTKLTNDCPLCGIELAEKSHKYNSKHIDHIFPLSKGGMHIKDNVRIICQTCNVRKGNREDFNYGRSQIGA